MDAEAEEGLVAAAGLGGRAGLDRAIAFWDSHHGSRAGFSEALLELQRRGRIRLRAIREDSVAGLSGIDAVQPPARTRPQSAGRVSPSAGAVDPRKVFVVHGQDGALRRSMFDFLRSIDLHPIEWSALLAGASGGVPYIGELLDQAFSSAQAVVVLSSPDEHVEVRAALGAGVQSGLQARPNVIFEAGMALGRAPERTVIVEVGPLRPFSDIAGRHVVRLDDEHPTEALARRQDLARRLRAIGCPVDIDGTDWHTVGRFVATGLDGA